MEGRKARVFVLAVCMATLGITSCSTMTLKQYPGPSPQELQSSVSDDGISAIAYPLKSEEEFKDYFGVNLTQKGILAVHLTVANNKPNVSYLIRAESIRLGQQDVISRTTNDPSMRATKAANAIGITGGVLGSPVLIAVAAQQLSNSTIIKENFESKEFRSKTIDTGQKASGFVYFKSEDASKIGSVDVCFDVIDSINNKSFTYCTPMGSRR